MNQGGLFDTPAPVMVISISMETVDAPSGGATIIAFPQDRNMGRIRRVALKLTERTGKLQESYWARSCNDLASMLLKAGHTIDQVDAQINAFHGAVSLELCRLANASFRQPGGAA